MVCKNLYRMNFDELNGYTVMQSRAFNGKKIGFVSLVRYNHLVGRKTIEMVAYCVGVWHLFQFDSDVVMKSVPIAPMTDTFVQWNMKIRSMLSLNESKMHGIRFVLSVEWAIDHCTAKCAISKFAHINSRQKMKWAKREGKTDGRIEVNSLIFHCASINGLSETCTRRYHFYCTFANEAKGEAKTARTHTHTIHTNAKDWPS